MAGCAIMEVLTTADEARWLERLDAIGSYDFCHLPAYSRLAELCGHGAARFFVYQERTHLLGFPLLLRELPDGMDPGLRDATSVYGYAGPLANSPPPDDVRQRFVTWVLAQLRDLKVVSAFSRMHPLLQQESLLQGFGTVAPVGWTLSIDLTLPETEQVAAYRRNHHRDIRRLHTMGVVSEVAGPERVKDFTAIYYENMDRVGASQEYYFGEEFFQRLLADLPGVTHLRMCFHEGRPIAGSVFTLCQGICQWYLSGSRSNFKGPSPVKLLFDEARRWAVANGAREFHLGGGVGGRRDSLYHFKRGFTQREHVFSVWKCILNPSEYHRLSEQARAAAGPPFDEEYFPCYRHPAAQLQPELESLQK